MSTLNAFSLSNCCCQDCTIIEQAISQSGVSPAPAWDSAKWIQDSGSWPFTPAGGGGGDFGFVEVSSSNSILRCANLFAAGTTISGPNVRVRISGGNPGDQFFIWWHDGSALYKWQITHSEKVELIFDGVGVQATVIGDPVANKSSVTTWAGLVGDIESPWDFTGWGVLSVQQCLKTAGGEDRIGRCSASTNAGSTNSTGEIMIEPPFLADIFRTRAANSWGFGTGTVTGTIRIESVVAYNPSIRDDINYWFDWFADSRPLELLPLPGTSPNVADNAWLSTLAPENCNTSGPRSREITDAANPIVPASFTVEPSNFSMLVPDSVCLGSLVGCVVDMQSGAVDYEAQPGIRGGSPLTGASLAYRWSYHNTESGWDKYHLVPRVYVVPTEGCEFVHAKIVYELSMTQTIPADVGDPLPETFTFTLVVTTYKEASVGGGSSSLRFTGTVPRGTDLTTISALELTMSSLDAALADGCGSCPDGDTSDLTGMSFKITAA
jgi:hypothetical protein